MATDDSCAAGRSILRRVNSGSFATRRFGLRFADSDVEIEYRRWHRVQGLVYARLGLGASIVGWLVAYVSLSATVDGFAVDALPWFGPMFVVLPLSLAATIRWPSGWPHLAHWTNTLAGLMALGASLVPYDTDDPTAIVITILFFGFTVYRLHPVRALLAVLPYLVVNQLAVVDAFRDGRLDLVEMMITSTYGYTALSTGIVVNAFLERGMRRAFADEHKIQAQAKEIESLLLNVLPAPIVDRLRATPGVIADRFEQVTILFADVVGFTPLAARIEAEAVVDLLNEVFSTFDQLTAAHGVEKIKTIGDAYMAVGGLPTPRPDHAQATADLAIAMRDSISSLRERTGHDIDVRIGLCSGAAVAGVIGLHKFAYDLWGDAVNVAARMESHGLPGAIQIAPETRALLADEFECIDRGAVDIKGRGPMQTSLLVGRRHAILAARAAPN